MAIGDTHELVSRANYRNGQVIHHHRLRDLRTGRTRLVSIKILKRVPSGIRGIKIYQVREVESSVEQNPSTSGHPVTAIATVKTVNALYKAQKLLRMNGAPIPHVWKSGKVFKIGYTSSNTEGIRKGIAALSGSTGVQLVQNPAVSLPRNKWVNASIRITSDGKIQAKVSSPTLSRSIRKRNPSSKKPSKYPKCSLCGKAIRDSTYMRGPDGPEHNVCPPTRGSGLYYMSRNPRRSRR